MDNISFIRLVSQFDHFGSLTNRATEQHNKVFVWDADRLKTKIR
jgi:hypothetical protein